MSRLLRSPDQLPILGSEGGAPGPGEEEVVMYQLQGDLGRGHAGDGPLLRAGLASSSASTHNCCRQILMWCTLYTIYMILKTTFKGPFIH